MLFVDCLRGCFHISSWIKNCMHRSIAKFGPLKKASLLPICKPDVLVMSKLTYNHFSEIKEISQMDEDLSN